MYIIYHHGHTKIPVYINLLETMRQILNLSSGNHSFKEKLLNFINSHSLYQPINLPTRITSTTSSLLDIFLVSDQGLTECAGVSDLAIADHMMIYLCLSWKRLKTKAALTCKRNFSKFDELDFCHDLDKCPWSILDTFDSPDEVGYLSVFLERLLGQTCSLENYSCTKE